MEKEQDKLILRDKLAIERTNMAIERTFLAYFRSSIFFFVSGLSIINIHLFRKVDYLGIMLIVLSPVLLAIGLYSMFRAKKKIKEFKEIQ